MIIYKTTNLITQEWYIGQDSKNNPNYFGSGIILKRAIKKYGKKSFTKQVLESLPEGSSKEDLNKAEIYWINVFNAVNDPKSYNIAFGGQDISTNPEVGIKISKKMIGNKNGIGERPHLSGNNWKGKRGNEHHLFGKISRKKGIPHTEEQRIKNAIAHGAKEFLMIEKNTGKLVSEFLIIMDCANKFGLCDSAISACLKGKRKSHKGYVFLYKDGKWL